MMSTTQPPRIETPTPENFLCKCTDCDIGFYGLLDWYEHRMKKHNGYVDFSKLQEYKQVTAKSEARESKLDEIRRKIVAELLGRQEWARHVNEHIKVLNDANTDDTISNEVFNTHAIKAQECSNEIAKIDARVDKLLEQYKLVTEGKA